MMSRSPGHRDHPEHQVRETPAPGRMTVEVSGQMLADSNDVTVVDEDGHPPRYYFARRDVRMENLERSATTSECPFKGHASYYELKLGGERYADAVWSYEQPYDEHAGLAHRDSERERAVSRLRSLRVR
jgi:uncharacterized protein (DUF427 family)